MQTDGFSLLLDGAILALMSGAILVFARYQYREMSPVMWWAGSDFALAAGLLALAFGGPAIQWSAAANAFGLTLGPALLWASARRFNGRAAPLSVVLGCPLVVLASAFLIPVGALTIGSVGLSLAFYLAAAWTLIAQAREPLRARWPLAVLCIIHGVAPALFLPSMFLRAGPLYGATPMLLELMHIETLAFLLGTTIFVVAAMREASELLHKRAADTDGLTGLLNRRAFLDAAGRILERCRYDATACAVVVVDLDRFKRINDTFGHAIGDRALQLFASVTRKALRPNDVLGRIGGEEFAVALSGAGFEAGLAMAERLRKTFADEAAVIDGLSVNATLSAGVSSMMPGDDLQALMKRADAMLYQAKLKGRNRVAGERDGSATKLVRLA